MDCNRRTFLAASTASALFAAHIPEDAEAEGASPEAPPKDAPRILALKLQTAAPLAQMKAFYGERLGLRVVEARSDRLTLVAGESRLTFTPTEAQESKPFYHFAFNIPENQILEARRWQLQRSPLMPIPERLRDAAFPNDVVDYSHWNAHSIFFFDPGGNVVEYIARHDLNNASSRSFSSKALLCLSEIGWIVDDVAAEAARLKAAVGVGQYRGGSDQFMALGDEQGLLLLMKRGRILDFSETSKAKAASVYPTKAQIRGAKAQSYAFAHHPYQIVVAK